jgi:hypothetical protein
MALLALWLAGGTGVRAVEPAVPPGKPAAPAADTAVLLDEDTLWRHFHIMGASHYRNNATGKLERATITWAPGGLPWKPVTQALFSPLPPADWSSPSFDDGAWPRLWWPQPVTVPYGLVPQPFVQMFDTAVVLARGKFEIKNPAQVKACAFSLDYWGGVVVYVNGKEVVRQHLPGTMTNMEAVAEDYPPEAFFRPDGWALNNTDNEKNRDRLALRVRQLREVKIPTSLLRQGVNVVAIEAHAAPALDPDIVRHKGGSRETSWPPIGVLRARLTVSPASAAPTVGKVGTSGPATRSLQVWNRATYDAVTVFDHGDPAEPLRPIVINAARNAAFSGRLMVGADGPMKGLKATVSDLARLRKSSSSSAKRSSSSNARVENEDDDEDEGGGAKIAASAVRIRCAVPATADKSWVAPDRFDGLLDAIPAEIPAITNQPPVERFYDRSVARTAAVSRAVAPLWFTVRVPSNAAPGVYEGLVSVVAEGCPPVKVPLQVRVCAWTAPDPRDFLEQNFIYYAEEVLSKYYEVPPWSDKHFELIGKTLAVLAEANSRQVLANLAVDFYGKTTNPESLVRWIKQPDGSYTYDFTNFDKYLDTVARTIGKPWPLRLNCWGEPSMLWNPTFYRGYGAPAVSLLDPQTGKLERLEQPKLGSKESLAFWRPVFAEILKKVQARGWLEATTIGLNSSGDKPTPAMVDVAYELWPTGVWSWGSHIAERGAVFVGTDTNHVMKVRHSENPWAGGGLGGPGSGVGTGHALANAGTRVDIFRNSPRETGIFLCRNQFSDNSPLTYLRRMGEHAILAGYDGTGDFGANQFPLKRGVGGYYCPNAGRGTEWHGVSTAALLYPGPDGPVASERFEVYREGMVISEARLFVLRAITEKKLSPELLQRASRYLDERSQGFMFWFGNRYMQSEEDAKLLDLAGEVAREMGK